MFGLCAVYSQPPAYMCFYQLFLAGGFVADCGLIDLFGRMFHVTFVTYLPPLRAPRGGGVFLKVVWL